MITDYKELADALRIEAGETQYGLTLMHQAANAIEELGAAFLRERKARESAYDEGFENGVYYAGDTSYAPLNPYRHVGEQ